MDLNENLKSVDCRTCRTILHLIVVVEENQANEAASKVEAGTPWCDRRGLKVRTYIRKQVMMGQRSA